MGRLEVRAALKNFLVGANITNLNQVLGTFPFGEIDYTVNEQYGQFTKACAVIFISGDDDARISTGAGVGSTGIDNGWKRVDYKLELYVFCRSLQPIAEDGMSDFDTLMDSIKTLLRQGSHRLGLPSGDVIWQAAEPAINASYGMPLIGDLNTVDMWGVLRFGATQMIQS